MQEKRKRALPSLNSLVLAVLGLIFLSPPSQARLCETGCQFCSCWDQTRGGDNICVKKGFLDTTGDCMRWCDTEPEGIFNITKDGWDECDLD